MNTVQAQVANEILAEQLIASMPAEVRARWDLALRGNRTDYAAAIIAEWVTTVAKETDAAIEAACRLPAGVGE